jgi:hypothetical protein
MERYLDRIVALATAHPGRSFGPQFASEAYADVLEANGLGFRVTAEDLAGHFGELLVGEHSFDEGAGRVVLVVGPYTGAVDDRASVEIVAGVVGGDVTPSAPEDAGHTDRARPRGIPGQPGRRFTPQARSTIPPPAPFDLSDASAPIAEGTDVSAVSLPEVFDAPPLVLPKVEAALASEDVTRPERRIIPGQPGRRFRR